MTLSVRKPLLTVVTAMLLVVMANHTSAQRALASIDTATIRIGEQVNLKLSVVVPEHSRVNWPVLADTLSGKIEIRGKGAIDSAQSDRQGFTRYQQILRITSFDTGYQLLAPLHFTYTVPGSSPQTLATDSIYLRVNTVAVDTTKAMRDIKPPASAPITFQEIAPYLAIAAGVAVLIALVWYLLWRRKNRKPLFSLITKPPQPAWALALDQLNALDQLKLWQNNRFKEYYSQLTDILRSYLQARFGINAPEMVSSDISKALAEQGIAPALHAQVDSLLQQSDLIKFAKQLPTQELNTRSLGLVREFVNSTIPQTQPETKLDRPTTEPKI